MSLQVLVPKDGIVCEIHHPGWSFRDYQMDSDLQPYLQVWRIFSLTDWSRTLVMNAGYLDWYKLEETHLMYIKCIDLQRVIGYSKFLSLGTQPFAYELVVRCELVRVGRTSFQFDMHILHAETKQPLFTSSIVYVCVDKNSRESYSLPDWWINKYKHAVSGQSKPLRISLKDVIPAESSVTTKLPLRVTPLDVDYYGHANNQAYPQFAANSILAALNRGCLSAKRRRLENSVKSIKLDYIGDCVMGDDLMTQTWEQEDNHNVLWTQVMKKDKIIYVQRTEIEPTTVSHL